MLCQVYKRAEKMSDNQELSVRSEYTIIVTKKLIINKRVNKRI